MPYKMYPYPIYNDYEIRGLQKKIIYSFISNYLFGIGVGLKLDSP